MKGLSTSNPFAAASFPPRRLRRALAGAATVATVIALLSAPVAAGVAAERQGCPLRFDQETTGLPRTCVFVGRFNTEDSREVLAAFAGDGSTFVVALARSDATPLLYLPADTRSATAGDLLRWGEGVQPVASAGVEAVGDQVVGAVTLEDGGRRLRIRAAAQPGSAAPPAEFLAHFATMVDAGEDTVVSSR